MPDQFLSERRSRRCLTRRGWREDESRSGRLLIGRGRAGRPERAGPGSGGPVRLACARPGGSIAGPVFIARGCPPCRWQPSRQCPALKKLLIACHCFSSTGWSRRTSRSISPWPWSPPQSCNYYPRCRQNVRQAMAGLVHPRMGGHAEGLTSEGDICGTSGCGRQPAQGHTQECCFRHCPVDDRDARMFPRPPLTSSSVTAISRVNAVLATEKLKGFWLCATTLPLRSRPSTFHQ